MPTFVSVLLCPKYSRLPSAVEKTPASTSQTQIMVPVLPLPPLQCTTITLSGSACSQRLALPAKDVISGMMERGILPGLCLADFTDDLVDDADHVLLVAVTEKRTTAEIADYVAALGEVLQAGGQP